MVGTVSVGIVDADSVGARELVDRLLRHPQVRVVHLQASSEDAAQLGEGARWWRGRRDLPGLTPPSIDALLSDCQAVFRTSKGAALPELPARLAEKGIRVFDFSCAYRFRNKETYQHLYGEEHPLPDWKAKSVYGLPELYRPEIIGASLISVPSNFATASILALSPLMKRDLVGPPGIIVDGKGGYSTASHIAPVRWDHLLEAPIALVPGQLQHTGPEIEEHLRRLCGEHVQITFMPHVVPAPSGTLVTCYANLSEKMDEAALWRLYRKFYEDEPFVRVLDPGETPQTSDVIGTNFCNVSVCVRGGGRQLVAVAVLDNLVKGAAGQAIQCFNVSYSFEETLGLF